MNDDNDVIPVEPDTFSIKDCGPYRIALNHNKPCDLVTQILVNWDIVFPVVRGAWKTCSSTRMGRFFRWVVVG